MSVEYSTLWEISESIKDKKISSVEVTQYMLDRIDQLNDTLHAYITVSGEQALQQAEALDHLLETGIWLGPLHGVPVAFKDNIDTAGILTTAGSGVLKNSIASEDATVVAKYKAAGAVVLGKLSMYEFAYGDVHPDFLEARNPWDVRMSCGASSSGVGSALAAGLAYGGVGSDTGGSVRLPAAFCGVVGLKPTFGWVSRKGVFPVSFTLDHVGLFGRCAQDVAIQLKITSGYDPLDPSTVNVQGRNLSSRSVSGHQRLAIGVPHVQSTEVIDPEVAESIRKAQEVFEDMGYRLVDVELPDHLLSRSLMWIISAVEAAEFHRSKFPQRPQGYSKEVRAMIDQGDFLPAADYVHALRLREKIIWEFRKVFETIDILLLPVVGFTAWPIGERNIRIGDVTEELMPALTRYCTPFNVTGQPAVSVPCGLSKSGHPIGMQLVGKWMDDLTLLRLADLFLGQIKWDNRQPAIG